MISARFHRSFDALDQVFGFTRRFYDAEGVPDEARLVLDFCLEEIFTNCVKYNRGSLQEIELALDRAATGFRPASPISMSSHTTSPARLQST